MIRSEDSPRAPSLLGSKALVCTSLTLLLMACGAKHESGSSQVVAKVNDDEITVHEVNFVLQQQRNVPPSQQAAVSRQVLERLIDQQLAVQKATELKLDRDPQTMQMLEAARREIVARRYFETEAQKTPAPADADVQKYYDGNPGLFSNRKVYSLQKVDIQVPADRRDEVVAHAQSAKGGADIVDWAASQGFKYANAPVTMAAEALPLQIVEQVASLKDGQSIAVPQAGGVTVLTLVSAQPAPKTLDEARPAITQFLTVEAQRNAVAAISKSLRDGAKIQYEGQFAASAAQGGQVAAPSAASDADTSAAHPSRSSSSASAGLDSSSIEKGLGH